MRAPPDIKPSWIEPFREPRAIDQGAEENKSTLSIVVGKTGFFVELFKREQPRCVDDWGKCRETSQNEDRKPE